MGHDVKLEGKLGLCVSWPIFMALPLTGITVFVFLQDNRYGAVMAALALVYLLVSVLVTMYTRKLILSELVDFAVSFVTVENQLLAGLPMPVAIVIDTGLILWENEAFREVAGENRDKGSYLSKMIPELNRGVLPSSENESASIEVNWKDRTFQVDMQYISVEKLDLPEQIMKIPQEKRYLVAIMLTEQTELLEEKKKNDDQRMVAGLIYIDNYDEVMESVEEVRQSLLVALIDRKINQYISNLEGIVKKLEKDKYFIAIKKESFARMQEDRFSLLEDVKGLQAGNSIPATLSIGLGLSVDTYLTGYGYARVAIDLALARGGDQAVVKTQEGISYFGGKIEQTSRNTRVKARVKAEALREFMISKERILVMGHKLPDVDSFGAAIGIYRIGATMGKKVNIVVNDITASLRPLYETFHNDPDYPSNMFVKSAEAEDLVDESTMVVVVDTNKPKLTDCEKLLRVSQTIAVLDHHRASGEAIENALLSYIEPYASSACEMVAEVLQYIDDNLKLAPKEADALYAGISVDTNNFMTRTGVRTFEAAAYLRRNGADITRVRKLLRDDLASYRAKAAVVSSASVYRDVFAIALGEKNKIESPTIVGAQAANELLNIDGIKASFVFTEFNGKIYLSARSIDEINVQLIAERLGGGGHMTTAGAQFEHTDIRKAVDNLKRTIDVMIAEGEI